MFWAMPRRLLVLLHVVDSTVTDPEEWRYMEACFIETIFSEFTTFCAVGASWRTNGIASLQRHRLQ